ncbi:TolC family protein [uncultured Hymenobacter sp.]|uniref:TolC family protein n=1 Tax=uncultured Hymenobacter sp. TaxID=170016 RepID=UPI0035CA6938
MALRSFRPLLRLRLALAAALLAGGGRAQAQQPAAGAPPVLGQLPAYSSGLPASPRRLDDFVAVARYNSPLLRDLTNQVSQIRLDSLRRKAQNGFQVNGTGAAVYYPSISNRAGEAVVGYDQAVTNGGNYAAVGQVSKPIFNRALLQNDYRILGSQGLVLRNSGRLNALDLRRSVTDQFLTAYAAQLQLEFSRGLLTQLRQQDKQLRQLVEAGIFKQTQYLSFYLSVRTQEVTVEQNRLAYRRELGTLRALAGVGDTALVSIEVPAPPRRRPLAGLLAPALRQYTLDSLRLQLDRRAVDTYYRPRVSALADAGLQSISYMPRALSRSLGVSGGLLLNIPIFDGHQRQLQYQRIALSEQSRQGYRQFLTGQRRQQYEQLENQIRASDALIVRIRAQLRIADALVGATRQQLATGEVFILDYLNVVTSYRTLQFNLTQAETDRLRSLYALDYLGEQ